MNCSEDASLNLSDESLPNDLTDPYELFFLMNCSEDASLNLSDESLPNDLTDPYELFFL